MLQSRALRTLLRLKLRGSVRRHMRRLKTPKGILLTVIGFGLFALWLGSITFSSIVRGGQVPDLDGMRGTVRLGAIALTTLSLSSALSHRGLFLPKEEIERLFSAPLRRGDLVRYRLLAGFGRSFFGGMILAVLVMPRMPRKLFAFCGVMVGMLTLPFLHQALAILLASLERRWARVLKRFGSGFFIAVGLLFGMLFFVLFLGRSVERLPLISEWLAASGDDPLNHPWLVTVTWPFTPWIETITATSWAQFLPWFGVCSFISLGLFEATASLPMDYRELSLETSANVAARIRRARRGLGGAAASSVMKSSVGWSIPWLFGRGPAGAIAWRKLGAIIRKARGTLWVSSLVLLFLTLLSTVLGKRAPLAEIAAPAMISFFGIFYLCAGVRFDFRDELQGMDVIKAWPLSPVRIFTAMILPEVLLVSVLLLGAVFLRAAIVGEFHPLTLVVCGFQPLLVFVWVALDNAVFLVVPIRFVAGQEGALQNAGRGMLLMLARMFFLFVGLVIPAGAGFLTRYLLDNLEVQPQISLGLGVGAAWATLLLMIVLLLFCGGVAFRRFDVARDRG